MKSRAWLNCMLVALALWLASRGRSGLWVRRSEGKQGRIPHTGIMRERGRALTVVDYIPRRRKTGIKDSGDCFVLFDGLFRVRRYVEVGIGTGDTLREAVRSAQAENSPGLLLHSGRDCQCTRDPHSSRDPR